MRDSEDIFVLSEDAIAIALKDSDLIRNVSRHLLASQSWMEVVAGMDSVAVMFDPLALSLSQATRLLRQQVSLCPIDEPWEGNQIDIPVEYGGDVGPDLAKVCNAIGVTIDDFINYHTSRFFTVELIGFTPGFAYVGGLDPAFEIPRLETPRRFVPAGSIGLVTGYTGLYSLDGPGGWPIIGQTKKSLFNPNDQSPFLVRSGDAIRFVAISP